MAKVKKETVSKSSDLGSKMMDVEEEVTLTHEEEEQLKKLSQDEEVERLTFDDGIAQESGISGHAPKGSTIGDKMEYVLFHSKQLVKDLDGIFIGGNASQSLENLTTAIENLEK